MIPGTMDFNALVEQAALYTMAVRIDLARDLAILQYTAGTTGKVYPNGASYRGPHDNTYLL